MNNNSEYFTRKNVDFTSSMKYRYWIAIKKEGKDKNVFPWILGNGLQEKRHLEESYYENMVWRCGPHLSNPRKMLLTCFLDWQEISSPDELAIRFSRWIVITEGKLLCRWICDKQIWMHSSKRPAAYVCKKMYKLGTNLNDKWCWKIQVHRYKTVNLKFPYSSTLQHIPWRDSSPSTELIPTMCGICWNFPAMIRS